MSDNKEIRTLFEVSIAPMALSKKWKLVNSTWEQFAKRLAKTVRTSESNEAFRRLLGEGKAGRERRQNIKDVGGYVGGELSSGSRKKSTVLTRSIVTLDLDNVIVPTSEVWAQIQTAFKGVELLIYTTHSHTPEHPRLRLIIPLSRNVTPAEYIPIARKIASLVDIEYFDKTTYQAERFMFWPSTSKDGEFIYKRQKGVLMNPKKILGLYSDYMDINEWPISQSEIKILQNGIDQQQDPTEKRGIIGAFCRTYGINEAIEEFLSNEYEKSDVPDRYTYSEGSSYNGLVVYDNKFAYSHHNTDPAGQQTCNSFDLVRLHKFGKLDNSLRGEKVDTTKLPSYKAMTEFCLSNRKVKQTLGKERIENATEYFSDLFENKYDDSKDNKHETSEGGNDGKGAENFEMLETLEVANTDWMGKMENDLQGKPLCTVENILLVLTNDPYFKGAFALDLFSQRIVSKQPLKWRNSHNQVNPKRIKKDADFETLVNVTDDDFQFIDDNDLTYIRWYLETVHKIPYNVKKVEDAICICAQRHAFHPIKDYLDSVVWDGVERVKYLFHDYMGAVNTEYCREVSEIFFTAAVARIYRAGCKFDYMPVLIGEQGQNKSSIIRALTAPWFSDSLYSMGDQKSFEQIQGSWAVEVAELSAMRRSNVDSVKHFITKQTDKFRPAFGHMVKNFSRTCVFFGTCNNEKFLKDDTGNRRFWPIKIDEQPRKFNLTTDFTDNDRQQIWAEAVQLYKSGKKLYLSKRLEKIAAAIQAGAMEVDERYPLIEEYINTPVPIDWDSMPPYARGEWYKAYQNGEQVEPAILPRKYICGYEIAMELFQMPLKECTNYQIRQINSTLQVLEGLEPIRHRFKWYGLQRGFEIKPKCDKNKKV